MKKITVILLSLLLLLTPMTAGAASGSAFDAYTAGWGEPVFSTSENFDGLADGMSFTEYKELGDAWAVTRASGADGHDAVGSSGALKFGPFTQLVSTREIKGRYTLQFDCKAPNNQFFGIFVRSTGEAIANKGYFEADGSSAGNDGLGCTGVYFMPKGNKLWVMIKVLDEAAEAAIGVECIKVDAGVSFEEDFRKMEIADNGSEIAVFVEGCLVTTVKYSDEKQLDYISEHKSYTTAVVYDKDGNELQKVSDCRISSEYSVAAFGMRISEAYVDNITLKEYGGGAEETERAISRIDMKGDVEKTQYLIGEELDLTGMYIEVTYADNVKEDVKITSDMVSGFDNTALGAEVITVTYKNKSTSFSVKIVNEYGTETQAPETLDFDTSPATTGEGDVGGKPNLALIIAVVGAVVVVAAVCVILLIRKRKA